MNHRIFVAFASAMLATLAACNCGPGDCVAFGEKNCLPADGARCVAAAGAANGTCQCCWALQSGSTNTCYGCIPACTDRGYVCSSDGVCVFPAPPAGPSCSVSTNPTGCSITPNCPSGTHQVHCQCAPN